MSAPDTIPADDEPLEVNPAEVADDEGEAPEDEAASRAALAAVAPESLREFARAWVSRIRAGESGMLPVLVGIVAIGVIFQVQNHAFLSAGNLTNLLVQGAVFMLLGMGEIYALLLGEIDLSIGFVSGIGGVLTAELVIEPRHWPWWSAIIVAIAATTAIGTLHGTLITRLRLPSFVVTLAGLLGWEGLMIRILGTGGTVPIPDKVVNDFANGNLSPIVSWVLMLGAVGSYAFMTARRDRNRRASGLVAPPASLTALKVALATAAGVVLVLVCDTNRGTVSPIRGVPWVVPIVLAVLCIYSLLLGRTRFGRYLYAVGGNPEAARRAGVSLVRIRTAAFALSGLTAGIAGIIYASRLRSVSTALDGGTLVLYAVASAVIGGASLFGGRGKPVHAVLGGFVIAAIYNGMGLLGMSAAAQFMITALVLLAAVTVDSIARRGQRTGAAR